MISPILWLRILRLGSQGTCPHLTDTGKGAAAWTWQPYFTVLSEVALSDVLPQGLDLPLRIFNIFFFPHYLPASALTLPAPIGQILFPYKPFDLATLPSHFSCNLSCQTSELHHL